MGHGFSYLDDEARLAALNEANDLVSIAQAFFGFLSPDGKVLALNDLSLEIIESTRDQVVGRPLWECPWWRLLPASAERIRSAVVDAASGRPSRFDIEYRGVSGGVGEVRWVDLSFRPFRDERIAVSGIDITDRKATEMKIEAVFEASPLAMALVTGPEFIFEKTNPTFERILGGRSFVGKKYREGLPELEGQPFFGLLTRVFETGIPYEGYEVPAVAILRPGGPPEQSYWDLTYTRIEDKNGQPYGVYIVGNEVSERVLFQRRMKETREALARSNEDLERFAHVASHDLQEPLRMVTMYIEILKRKLGNTIDADAENFMRFILDGSARMQRLVGSLLEYSKVGKVQAEAEVTEGAAVVGEALENLKLAIDESGATINVSPLPRIRGERTQLVQLFQNLVGNAIKYRDDRTPRIDIEYCEGRFRVRDNGIGFDVTESERIFEPFHRLHTKSKYPGTGLGLAVCRRIVERHGGTICADSTPGLGSIFHFTLSVTD